MSQPESQPELTTNKCVAAAVKMFRSKVADVLANVTWYERAKERQEPGDPSPCAWGVERRAEFSPLGPGAGCFLGLGSSLGLVGTASSRR